MAGGNGCGVCRRHWKFRGIKKISRNENANSAHENLDMKLCEMNFNNAMWFGSTMRNSQEGHITQ